MQIKDKILNIINNNLKNPIYKTIQLLNIKSILKKSNFIKKDGASIHLVILHFVYMLVMNKKIHSYIKQSNDKYSKDVYYRLLNNTNYNWRKLLSFQSLKILSLLEPLRNNELKVLILDDTIENKVGKIIEGSCDKLYSNKEKRLVRGLNIVSLNYSDGYSNFMLDFAIAMNKYARVKIQDFTNKIDYRTNAYKRRIESLKGKSVIAIE